MERTREDIGAIKATLKELSKSYKTLNDAHEDTDKRLRAIETRLTKIETTANFIKWLVSAGVLSFGFQLALAFGWIPT